MKHLKTLLNGGFPFKLDDIRYLQESFEDRIAMFFKDIVWPANESFENPPANTFIVHGVNITSSTSTSATWTAGVVCIDGILYTLDAGTISFSYPSTAPFIVVDNSTYNPAGNKTFENATTHGTYELRKAKVEALTIFSGGLVVQNHMYLATKRRFSWGKYSTYEITAPTSIFVNGVTPVQDVHIYQDANGDVKLTGSISVPASFGGQAMILPTPARPATQQAFVLCNVSQDPGAGFARCIVDTDGKLWIQPYDSQIFSGDEEFNLAAIRIVKGL